MQSLLSFHADESPTFPIQPPVDANIICVNIADKRVYGTRILARTHARTQTNNNQTKPTQKQQQDNPPPDASDPEEWRRYFRRVFGAHATVITVDFDNDLLLNALVTRREYMRQIELHVEPGTELNTLTLARIGAEIEQKRGPLGRIYSLLSPGVPELFGRIAELEAKIKGWAQVEYPVSNIFVSFETEEGQRRILSALARVGTLDVKRNNLSALEHPTHAFRHDDDDDGSDDREGGGGGENDDGGDPFDLDGSRRTVMRGRGGGGGRGGESRGGARVLRVTEPDEPNTIRWADLNVKFKDKLKPLVFTTISSIVTIAFIAAVIKFVYDRTPVYSSIAIALFNAVFPEVAKALTSLEKHSSEGGKQTSLYFKIAVFRWVTTAIVITVITPFTRTLDNKGGLIPTIYAIFFAELVTTNVIQLLDPWGHVQRHFFAPRAATQDLMNLTFKGAVIELAERYTNMTKILFLALWYCSIYPGALFMCSFVLFVNYFTDRFSLMRTWKRAPALGTRISKFSRRYFFSTAIVAMAIISAYFWAGFPYDNLCPLGSGIVAGPDYEGEWTVTFRNHEGELERTEIPVSVSAGDRIYRFCLQDFYRIEGRGFPPVPKQQPPGEEWMTTDQEIVTTVHGYSALGVMGCVALSFVLTFLLSVKKLFRGDEHRAVGDEQGVHFSDVKSISAYIPQVMSNVFSYPLIACDTRNFDAELYDWSDPDRPYSYYDLTMDAADCLEGLGLGNRHVFSIVSHQQPPSKAYLSRIQRRAASTAATTAAAAAAATTTKAATAQAISSSAAGAGGGASTINRGSLMV